MRKPGSFVIDSENVIPTLDRCTSVLYHLGLSDFADRLEEFTGDLEEELAKALAKKYRQDLSDTL